MEAFLNASFHSSLHQEVRDLLSLGSEIRRCRNDVQQQAAKAQFEAETQFKRLLCSSRIELDHLMLSMEHAAKEKSFQRLREASAKFCIARSNLSEIISDGKQRIEGVSEDLSLAVHLRHQALLFRKKLDEFEEEKYKPLHHSSKQLPWQLTYCVETDPFATGGGVVEFAGTSFISCK